LNCVEQDNKGNTLGAEKLVKRARLFAKRSVCAVQRSANGH